VPINLLSVDEARTIILNALKTVEAETISFAEGTGRILAEQVVSGLTLPPFSNSAMDGYAVRSMDLEHATPKAPALLFISGEVAAGQSPGLTLAPGEALKISTGAQIPPGADAVVPLEWTSAAHGRDPSPEIRILIERSIEAGTFIRHAGQDVQHGDILLEPGRRLRPQDIGMLASIGQTQIQVYRRPRVALFSSGDELLEPDQALQLGMIHDSNRYALSSAVAQLGGEVDRLPIAADALDKVSARLDEAASRHPDIILSSAGVSVGEHDHVRAAVEQGGELSFWRVNIRPGRPLAFGFYQGIPFLGLPGNPVSSMVTFEVFARPAIAKLGGLLDWKRTTIPVRMGEYVSSDGRETYLRAIVRRMPDGFVARLTGNQDSGVLSSLVRANAIVRIPAARKQVIAGDPFEAWLIGPVTEMEQG